MSSWKPDEFRWGTPPPFEPGRPSKWRSIAAALRKKPGEWAQVGEWSSYPTAHGYAARIARVSTSVFRHFAPAGSFEAVVRKAAEDGQPPAFGLWVRYVGLEEPPA